MSDNKEELEEVFNPEEIPQKYDVTEAALKKIEALPDKIVIDGPTDEEGYQRAEEAYEKVRSVRIDIEKTRKKLKRPFLDAGRRVDSVAKQLSGRVEPVEDQLEKKIEKADREREALKRAKKRENVEKLLEAGFKYDDNTNLYILANCRLEGEQIAEADEAQLNEWIETAQAEQERIEKAQKEAEEKLKKAEEAEKRVEEAEKRAAEIEREAQEKLKEAERKLKQAEEAEKKKEEEAAGEDSEPDTEGAGKNEEPAEDPSKKPKTVTENTPGTEADENFKEKHKQGGDNSSNASVENDPFNLEGDKKEAENGKPQEKSADFYRGFNTCKQRVINEVIKNKKVKKRSDMLKRVQGLEA